MDIGGTSPIIPLHHHHHYDDDAVNNRYVIDDDDDEDDDDNDDVYHLSNSSSNRHKLDDIDVQNDNDVFNSTSSSIQRFRDNTKESLRSQQKKRYSDKLLNSNPYFNKIRNNNNNNNNNPHNNNNNNNNEDNNNDIEDDNCSVMSNQTFQLQSQHRRQLPINHQHNDDDHEDHDQLPNIEMYKATMNNEASSHNKRSSASSSLVIFLLSNFYLTIFCVCIFFCVIALTIGFVIGENSISTTTPPSTNNNNTNSSNSNTIPQSSPQTIIKSRLELAIELVLEEEWSDVNTLSNINYNDIDTPQYLALNWLANDDPVQIEITPNIEFIQRYVLAVLFYSTGGNTKWEYSYNFLNPDYNNDDHVCNWSMLWNVKTLNSEPILNTNDMNDIENDNDGMYYKEVGIICDYEHPYITQIYIPNNQLYGTIPKEIRLLTNLKEFNLYNNNIYGIIPSELSQLLNLEALILHTNNINDIIPLWLPSLFKLNILNIGNNPNVTGIIPFNINLIQNLTILNIENCALTGNIQSLYGLKYIKSIHLSKNTFTGTLSNDIFDTWKDTIIELDISNNQFTGILPTQLFNADHIMIIDVNSNNFIGPIFETVQILLNNQIQLLALHNNMFNGTIYPTITQFQQLQHLDLSNNTFTGIALLPSISILTSLKYLYIALNPYFNTSTIPSEIKYLTNLIDLSLQNSNIIGTIPSEISYLTNLVLLDLNDNLLTSTIPEEIGNQLSNLHFLLLQNNQLNGTIPTTFIQLNQLDTLLLNGNMNINNGANEFCIGVMEIMDDDMKWLNTFYADCQPFKTNNDNCTCCTICCDDYSNEDNIAYCSKQKFFQNFDPSNQYHYTRRFYQFNEEELLYPIDPLTSKDFYNIMNSTSTSSTTTEYGPILDNTPIIGNNNDDIMFYTDDEAGIEIDDEMLLDYTDSEYFGNTINISTSP